MYKVSEVAEMLSLEKNRISEILIVYSELLAQFVTNEKKVSYISENGVREIERIIINFSETTETIKEMSPDTITDEISDKDDFDKTLETLLAKKSVLKNEIIDFRRQLNILDKEIRHRDDTIINYQNILNDDQLWLMKLEAKIEDVFQTESKELVVVEEFKKTNFFDKFRK